MVEVYSPPLSDSTPEVPVVVPARPVVGPSPAIEEPPLVDVTPLLRDSPPWLLSALVHMSALIVLGLLFLHPKMEDDLLLDAGYTEYVGDDIDEPTDLANSELEIDDAVLVPQNLPVVDDPFSTPDVNDFAPNPVFGAGPVAPSAIGIALTGREPGMKEALVKAYGGTAKTEGAVDLGLKWLASRQLKTGMWSLSGPYADGSRSNNDEAATGMALLAFQGAGYTPQGDSKHPFTPVVRRGWDSLLKSQGEDGEFWKEGVRNGQQLYTHAICTIALCELFAMTGDYQYREPAQKAIDYAVKIQAAEGGWRYYPGIESDMSVTGWFVMALQSARMAGLDVPSTTMLRVEEFLDSVAREGGSQYAYRARDGAKLALTAEGLLCRQYLGWERDDPRLVTGVDYILANPPEWDEQNVYYWYYATQVCHHMEDDAWRKWNEQMRKLLPEKQLRRGRERGSWDPDNDVWGTDAGRLYVTCLSIYILEVYYRHLPLYQTGTLGAGL